MPSRLLSQKPKKGLPPQSPGENAPIIELAHPGARPIFWAKADGSITGPGSPEFLARTGDSFWVVCQFQGMPVWVNSDRLRSKRQFEQQCRPHVVERIKERR